MEGGTKYKPGFVNSLGFGSYLPKQFPKGSVRDSEAEGADVNGA